MGQFDPHVKGLMASLSIRAAESTDLQAIATLLGDLGYPARPDEIPGRLEGLRLGNQAEALVALDQTRVVGLLTWHMFVALHDPAPVALVTALIVAESSRSRGAGRLLISAAEAHARARGCARIIVTTAEHRSGAHAFYARMGWEYTGRRFAKRLTAAPGTI